MAQEPIARGIEKLRSLTTKMSILLSLDCIQRKNSRMLNTSDSTPLQQDTGKEGTTTDEHGDKVRFSRKV